MLSSFFLLFFSLVDFILILVNECKTESIVDSREVSTPFHPDLKALHKEATQQHHQQEVPQCVHNGCLHIQVHAGKEKASGHPIDGEEEENEDEQKEAPNIVVEVYLEHQC